MTATWHYLMVGRGPPQPASGVPCKSLETNMEPEIQTTPQPDEWTPQRLESARAAIKRENEQESREYRQWQENRRHQPRQTRKKD